MERVYYRESSPSTIGMLMEHSNADRSAVCPACSSRVHRILWKRDGLSYLRCTSCTLAHIYPLKDSHDSIGGANSSRTRDSSNEMMLRDYAERSRRSVEIAARLAKYYAEVMGAPPGSILDVGCGDGALYEGFRKCGIQWTGIDANPSMVALAQDRDMPVYLQDFLEMSDDVKYDVIHSSQVLEHSLRPDGFILQAKRLLNPGGLLHIDVPNDSGLIPALRRFRPRDSEYGFLQPPYHLIAYNPKALRKLLERCNWKPAMLRSVSNIHPTFGQVHVRIGAITHTAMKLTGLLRAGSMLVCVAMND